MWHEALEFLGTGMVVAAILKQLSITDWDKERL
jgi:hypothetical protein